MFFFSNANDTTLSLSDLSLENLIPMFKKKIESFLIWVKFNHLTINLSKTQFYSNLCIFTFQKENQLKRNIHRW